MRTNDGGDLDKIREPFSAARARPTVVPVQVTTFEPRVSARVVEGLALVETTGPAVRTLLPEPAIIVGFRYRGASAIDDVHDGSLPDAVVTGVRLTIRRMHTTANSGIVLARLRPGAGRAVLGRSTEALFGSTSPFATWLGGDRVEPVRERVRRATSHDERAAIVENFLVECARGAPVDGLVDHAWEAIEGSRGNVRIGDLAASLGVSVDTLEKRFRRATGSTPKAFAKIVRVRRALFAAKDEPTLARAAAAAGYCDESHFVREVKAITGSTPTRFLARASEAC